MIRLLLILFALWQPVSAAYTCSGTYSLTTDSKTKSVTPQEATPRGIYLADSDTKLYVIGSTNNTVYQYTLSTPGDISTASYASKSLSVAAEVSSNSEAVFVGDSGTKLYVIGRTNDTVYQYTLSTPYDVSTGSYASKSLSVSTQDGTPRGISINDSGTKLYMVGSGTDTIYQYTLSTPYDVSTGSYASKSKLISAEETAPAGLTLYPDGNSLLMAGNIGGGLDRYTLSTPYDISTASASSFTSVATINDGDVTISANGSKAYILISTYVVTQYSTGITCSQPPVGNAIFSLGTVL